MYSLVYEKLENENLSNPKGQLTCDFFKGFEDRTCMTKQGLMCSNSSTFFAMKYHINQKL